VTYIIGVGRQYIYASMKGAVYVYRTKIDETLHQSYVKCKDTKDTVECAGLFDTIRRLWRVDIEQGMKEQYSSQRKNEKDGN